MSFFEIFSLFVVAPIAIYLWWSNTFKSTKYGSATISRKSRILKKSNKGLVIDGKRRLSLSDSFVHALLSATTGSGKSLKYILINILMCRHSMVITDVKSELYNIASPYLYKQGYEVLTLDIGDVEQSLKFNALVNLLSDSGAKAFTELLYELNSGTSKTPAVWKQGAIDCVTMCLNCLRNIGDERYLNLPNLIHVLNNLDVSNDCKRAEPFFAMFGRDEDNRTLEMFKRFKEEEIKIRYGKYTGALTMLSQFNTTEMRKLMSKNEFDFSLLRRKKTAIFLKVPSGKQLAFAPLLTIFFSQLFDYLLSTEIKKNDNGVFVLMDEFGVLNKIPSLMEILSLGRSQKVSISIACQSLQQIKAKYQDDFQSIMDNINSHIILPGINNIDTLKYYQHLLGQQSFEEYDPTTNRTSITSRPIRTMDEIRCLPDKAGLFIHRNKQPVELRMKPIYEQRRLMAKCGIKSVNGQLISTLPPVPIKNRATEPIQYIDFDWLKDYVEKNMRQQSNSLEVEVNNSPTPNQNI